MKRLCILAVLLVIALMGCGAEYQSMDAGDPCETISCSEFGDCKAAGGAITCDCPDDSDCTKDTPCYLTLDCRCGENYLSVLVSCAVDREGQPGSSSEE